MLQIMWRRPGRSLLKTYSWKSSLFIGDIVEVRFGQQTKNFEEFPYAEVEKQSLSLIVEKVRFFSCKFVESEQKQCLKGTDFLRDLFSAMRRFSLKFQRHCVNKTEITGDQSTGCEKHLQ